MLTGAQYITISSVEFQDFLKTHLPQDLLVPWDANFARLEGKEILPEELGEVRYVPRPSMSTLCEYLAASLPVKTQIKIGKFEARQSLDFRGSSWPPLRAI